MTNAASSASEFSGVRTEVFTVFLRVVVFLGAVFLAAVLLSFLILLEVWRIRKEEETLLDRFGAEYLDYKAKTWF